jgi:hypothetical protein
MAAAKTLGRLALPEARAVKALSAALLQEQEPAALRAMSAWALGEIRSAISLDGLCQALRRRLDPQTGQYLLEALAKHLAVLSRDDASRVAVAEALVFFAGNQTERVPALYDVINARIRTLPVDVQILDRALEGLGAASPPEQRAAAYNATYELLVNLEDSRDEVVSREEAWSTQVREALRAAARARTVVDRYSRLLVTWFFGRISTVPELAKPAAEALLGPAGQAGARQAPAMDARDRLVWAWALSRMQVFALGPRQVLDRDLLSWETHSAVLALLGAISAASGTCDLLQKILGITACESGHTRGGQP